MIIVLSTQGERKIAIVSESYALVFKSVEGEGIDKPVCNIELVPKSQLRNHGFEKLSASEIFGFIGLIEINGLIFIGAIAGKQKVAQPIPGETVNKILSIEFFCLNSASWDFITIDENGYAAQSDKEFLENPESVQRHPCYELRKLLSNGSFYYSSDFDLTSILQRRGYGTHSLSADTYEQEYMWNYFLMKEVVQFRDRLDMKTRQILDDDGFLTTVICGFAETFITLINQHKTALTIISKQSWKRAGTRFNARGVDDNANVANFVETELIMYSLNYCYSFTQIRGSIPVFWEQDTAVINPKVQIRRSFEATQPVFDEHFSRLVKKYGPVHVVNLLAYKPSEIELSKSYRDHLSSSEKVKLNKDVFLTNFDFHKETAGGGFSGVRKLQPMVQKFLDDAGYFAYDVKNKKILSKQKGIFRTNCLDCLDRTNVAQQTIDNFAFIAFLQHFSLIDNGKPLDGTDFINKLNTLWADHGDQISQIYTGTNALKSSYSRKGKMSFAGLLSDATKSVSRMYINTFMDSNKQQNIDFLLGRLPHQNAVELFDPLNQYVQKQLLENESLFTSTANAQIMAGSFNVNAYTQDVDLTKWLYPISEKFKPDIVVLGFQEVIELSASSLLNADYTKSTYWQEIVNKCLNQFGDKYLLLRIEQVTSLLILFFVKSDKTKYITEVEGTSKKTGFGGIAGNKGAVCIRFKYGETSLAFVNSHFAAGENNVEERRNDYRNIMEDITFSRSKTISHHDSIFWLGDLNYRLNLANDLVRYELETKRENYISNLLKYDQLTQEISAGFVFDGFKEAPITFRPTYKYDNQTTNYDSSEKARTPSWTDRILYKGANINSLSYSDAKILISDHMPVYGAFRVKASFVDEEAKNSLTMSLQEKYKVQNPEKVSVLQSSLGESDESLIDFMDVKTTDVKTESPVNLSTPDSDLLSEVSSVPARVLLRPPPPPAGKENIDIEKEDTLNETTVTDTRTNDNDENVKKSDSGVSVIPPGFNDQVLVPLQTNKTEGK